MKKKIHIALLPGDGIGPEVCQSVKQVINCLNNNACIDFSVDEDLIGGCSYEKHKIPITDFETVVSLNCTAYDN